MCSTRTFTKTCSHQTHQEVETAVPVRHAKGYAHSLLRVYSTVANGTAPEHLPFADAIAYMHTLSLRSQKDFREFVKTSACPAKIPRQPQRVYKHDVWLGFPH